jgi:tRNA(Ile)-lysidine synthase
MNAPARRFAAAEVIAPELVRRFASDLARLWAEDSEGSARLGVAVSGGPDSLALLLLAVEALPDRVAAATVDHGLRPDSAAEAAMVARVCRERGVAHETLPITLPAGNVQAQGRVARYAALADWAGSRAGASRHRHRPSCRRSGGDPAHASQSWKRAGRVIRCAG